MSKATEHATALSAYKIAHALAVERLMAANGAVSLSDFTVCRISNDTIVYCHFGTALRLQVALNLATFTRNEQNNPLLACKIARQAYEEGASEIQTLRGDSYADSARGLQMLRDHVARWTCEMAEAVSGTPHVK